jgi:hypothetical protein
VFYLSYIREVDLEVRCGGFTVRGGKDEEESMGR